MINKICRLCNIHMQLKVTPSIIYKQINFLRDYSGISESTIYKTLEFCIYNKDIKFNKTAGILGIVYFAPHFERDLLTDDIVKNLDDIKKELNYKLFELSQAYNMETIMKLVNDTLNMKLSECDDENKINKLISAVEKLKEQEPPEKELIF